MRTPALPLVATMGLLAVACTAQRRSERSAMVVRAPANSASITEESPTTPAPSNSVGTWTEAACPPLGRWKLQANVRPCTGIERFDVEVAAGLPHDAKPVLPPALPIVAAGRTSTGNQPYETLLIVSDPQTTATGCVAQVHLEYVGPHEMLTYDVRVQIERGRLKGKGSFDYEADDCRKPDPDECSCLGEASLTGEIGG